MTLEYLSNLIPNTPELTKTTIFLNLLKTLLTKYTMENYKTGPCFHMHLLPPQTFPSQIQHKMDPSRKIQDRHSHFSIRDGRVLNQFNSANLKAARKLE